MSHYHIFPEYQQPHARLLSDRLNQRIAGTFQHNQPNVYNLLQLYRFDTENGRHTLLLMGQKFPMLYPKTVLPDPGVPADNMYFPILGKNGIYHFPPPRPKP